MNCRSYKLNYLASGQPKLIEHNLPTISSGTLIDILSA